MGGVAAADADQFRADHARRAAAARWVLHLSADLPSPRAVLIARTGGSLRWGATLKSRA
jgi:hypothetical protein